MYRYRAGEMNRVGIFSFVIKYHFNWLFFSFLVFLPAVYTLIINTNISIVITKMGEGGRREGGREGEGGEKTTRRMR